jgi:hypothetical protein
MWKKNENTNLSPDNGKNKTERLLNGERYVVRIFRKVLETCHIGLSGCLQTLIKVNHGHRKT